MEFSDYTRRSGRLRLMEGRAMVSYLTGSMNSLVEKLTKLENRPKIIQELQEDLVALKEGFFDKLAGRGEMDAQVKAWMKQVRELFFDIEDWIDQKPETNTGESEREEEIEEFKILIQEAGDLCTRYELLKKAPTCGADVAGVAPSEVTFDYQLLLGEKTCLVALDRPKEQLKKHLKDEQKLLKVVSIVGTGGLGKTTLAKEVHGELLREFQCGAFVHVGRNPSIRTILINILHQIMSPREHLGVFKFPREPEVILEKQLDENQVTALLWEFLSKKRYFIVLDGIWSIRAGRVISCALPDNNLGSRILTTTRIKDVAEYCSPRYTDVVHQMEALGEEVSENLYVEQAKRPVDDDILKMCCGMPLAIIVAAGLLPRKSEELAEPKILGEFILSSLDQYSTSEGMTRILHMSYADISMPVKSCFLYLGIFPEYYTIKKDHLIRLWEAEGFIPRIDKESLWVTGEKYFNELISRRLVQPVFDYDDDQAVGCTVHGVVLDFIRSLSREDNFATTAAELSSGPFPCDTIRRFSLDCSNEDEADTLASSRVHLSSMRSLTVFGDVDGVLDLPSPSVSEDDEENVHSPSSTVHLSSMRSLTVFGDVEGMLDLPSPSVSVNLLSTFKLIRVLDLEDTKNLKEHHLEGIGGLVLLRYLGLGGTGINRLPEEIGELEQLETLDLRRTTSLILPASIVRLRKLVRLLLDIHPDKISGLLEMQELEEVSNICVDQSSLRLVAELLSKSNRLRMLGVTLDDRSPFGTETNLMFFLEEVVKSNLHSLSLGCHYDDESVRLLVDSWKKVTAPPVTFEPRRFELISMEEGRLFGSNLTRIPPNMASLVSLTHLRIEILKVEKEGLGILGGLPNLVLLNLSSEYAPRKRCVIKKGVFPCLKVLSFTCHSDRIRLFFQEGAMPQLRRFSLSFKVAAWNSRRNLDFGIKHLTFLTRVHATINCYLATVSDVEAMEAHIRAQVSLNPNKPTLELSRADEDRMSMDEGQHS